MGWWCSSTAARFAGQAYIGSAGLSGNNIDEFRIWDHVRSARQIQQGMRRLVQLSEPGQVVNFRFDDGRRSTPGNTQADAADGLMIGDAQGTEDFTHRIHAGDLEHNLLYNLRNVTFDYDNAVYLSRCDEDDFDNDGIVDGYENLHFNELTTYYRPFRGATGDIEDSTPINTRIIGGSDPSVNLLLLGWNVDFTPILPLPGIRWAEVPDAGWLLKDFYVTEEMQSFEMRVGIDQGNAPSNTLFYINGQLFDFGQPGIGASPNTFPVELGATFQTYFVPNMIMTNFIVPGRNRIAVQMINDDSFADYEYLNLEITADSDTFLVQRGDDPEITDSLLSRWWTFSEEASLIEPPLDGRGLAWWEKDYSADEFADSDNDGLTTLYEAFVNTNPKAADTDGDTISDSDEDFDGDGVQNGVEFLQGSDPRLVDTDDDGFTDQQEVQMQTDPADSLNPRRDFVIFGLGAPGSYVDLDKYDPRFALADFSLEAWVQPAALGSDMGVIERETQPDGENYRLGVDAAGLPYFRFSASDGSGPITLTAPARYQLTMLKWAHLACSFDEDSGFMKLYVNGFEVATHHTEKLVMMNGVEFLQGSDPRL
ncbi:MAG: LamG-like jellyroll fold domain-containing protein, partial [Verrucomicrobiota bacterium]